MANVLHRRLCHQFPAKLSQSYIITLHFFLLLHIIEHKLFVVKCLFIVDKILHIYSFLILLLLYIFGEASGNARQGLPY